jgi:hypothetical protein
MSAPTLEDVLDEWAERAGLMQELDGPEARARAEARAWRRMEERYPGLAALLARARREAAHRELVRAEELRARPRRRA